MWKDRERERERDKRVTESERPTATRAWGYNRPAPTEWFHRQTGPSHGGCAGGVAGCGGDFESTDRYSGRDIDEVSSCDAGHSSQKTHKLGLLRLARSRLLHFGRRFADGRGAGFVSCYGISCNGTVSTRGALRERELPVSEALGPWCLYRCPWPLYHFRPQPQTALHSGEPNTCLRAAFCRHSQVPVRRRAARCVSGCSLLEAPHLMIRGLLFLSWFEAFCLL